MSDSEGVPSLAEIPAAIQRLVIAYYEAGLDHGFQLGYRASEAHYEAAWSAFAAKVRHAAAAKPYDELCEERGERDRAESQRRLLKERGITP